MSSRHYLDHASTSPLRPEAAAALREWSEKATYADPGRQYGEGRVVRDAVEDARGAVAEFLHVRPREIVFTSGGTEAVNAASWGARVSGGPDGPMVCSMVEHSAVRLGAERAGAVVALAVGADARIDLDQLASILDGSRALPALVHCQWANHEVGTVQPLAEVLEMCRSRGVPVHVDACAAAGQVPLDLGELGADLVSVSAHKLGGPPGVGALVVRRGKRIAPMLVGADQERARRAGMENVPGILGFAAVAEALAADGVLAAAAARSHSRTEALRAAALGVDGVVAYGDPVDRLPHLVCLGVPGVEAEGIVLALDQAGIAVHSGSACSSEGFEPSPVLEAMGVDAQRSLRISVGWSTTAADVEAFGRRFPEVVARLRALGAGG